MLKSPISRKQRDFGQNRHPGPQPRHRTESLDHRQPSGGARELAFLFPSHPGELPEAALKEGAPKGRKEALSPPAYRGVLPGAEGQHRCRGREGDARRR